MFGRQHLQMLTCEFEREAEACAKAIPTCCTSSSPTSTVVTNSPEVATCQAPVTIPQFTETFLEQNLSEQNNFVMIFLYISLSNEI